MLHKQKMDGLSTNNRYCSISHICNLSHLLFLPSLLLIPLQLLSTQELNYIMQYYTKFDFDCSSKVYDIYKLFLNKIDIKIATDSDAIPQQGSLGFIIAQEDGTHLFKFYGQPAGIDALSYRSEICALLTAPHIIHLFAEYYNAPFSKEKKSLSTYQTHHL